MAAVDLSIGEPDAPETSAASLGTSAPRGDQAGPGGQDRAELRSEPMFVEDQAPEVEEVVVRTMLASMGGMLHVAIGDDDVEDHWEFTDRELDQLTPPLTRWINRQPRLRRALAHGDELAIAVSMAGYLGRNISDGQAARRARDHEEHDDHADVDREADRPPRGPDGPSRGVPYWLRPDVGDGVDGGGVPPSPGGGPGR